MHKFQLSEAMLSGLLAILTTVHNGERFNVDDIRGVNAKYFYSRRRSQHPLLDDQILVPTTRDDQILVPTSDIPINVILDRKLRSLSFVKCLESAGGKVLTSQEAEQNGLSSHHLFGVPTEPLENALSTNMHGSLARSSPFFGFDGMLGVRTGNRKVYINDVAMFTIDDVRTVPCRFLELYWDLAQNTAMVSVRRFRTRVEMRDVDGRERFKGLVRVWEEEGPDSKLAVGTGALQDVCEIYTRDKASFGMHLDEQSEGGGSMGRLGRFWRGGFHEAAAQTEEGWRTLHPFASSVCRVFRAVVAGRHRNRAAFWHQKARVMAQRQESPVRECPLGRHE